LWIEKNPKAFTTFGKILSGLIVLGITVFTSIVMGLLLKSFESALKCFFLCIVISGFALPKIYNDFSLNKSDND
jgi:hypothetical protein